eukprot:GHUV01018504.1.p1 GENE.GHUV01018504.1~~GHUV01018504.1.p1  ORF type:complete len:182 (+),score=36.35 GHUV01018504.1:205-750(+)
MRLAGSCSSPSLLAPRPLAPPRTALAKPAQRRYVGCHAAVDLAKFGNKSYLDKAAQRFKIGLEQGLEEDFLIAIELGATSLDQLSEAQLEYVDKIKAKLLERASEIQAEEAERRQREAAYFEAGKKAYERGQYENSVSFLEKAVEQCGRTSVSGGEAMMWLALAYQVCSSWVRRLIPFCVP